MPFDGLIRLEWLRKQFELEDIAIETSKTEKQREERLEKTELNIKGLWNNNQR